MASVHNTNSNKYLMYFVTAFLTCYLTQEILLNRLISIGAHYYITGGTFVYFASPLIIDVVTEVYGYKIARQLLWCGLVAPLFMALCFAIFTHPAYPAFWSNMIGAYNTVLDPVVRVAIVSSITIFIGQLVNVFLISKWRVLTRGKYFWLRCLGASVIGDSVTVVSSILLIFSGRIPLGILMDNIIPELVIMVVFTALGAIPAVFLAKIVAKKEGLNNYDTKVDFNPFKLND